jgi:TonB-dependent Receptor Plug Domain
MSFRSLCAAAAPLVFLRLAAPLLQGQAVSQIDNTLLLQQMVVYGRENNLEGMADSPSQGEVGTAEIEDRPFLRRGELLEVIPGLIVTQHSGDGKANQYFLRGFNLDHGTDFATTVDGMPVNLPSNAHGQGYSDLNFIIPELIQSITYQKGTYYAENGDFSAAGAAQFHLMDSLERGFVKIEIAPADNYYRAVAADSVRTAGGATTFALEYGYDDGPWDNPEHANHISTYGRRVWSEGDNEFAVTVIAYHAAWNSTDQVPERAIDEGVISRFGALDPSDGGTSMRANLDFNWVHNGPDSRTQLNAYAQYYRLGLDSDFTYFLVDPVHGDQFAQRDRRGTFGGSGSHDWTLKIAGKDVKTTVGFEDRADTINLGLFHTEDRGVINPVDLSAVHEYSAGVYVRSEIHLSDWFRVEGGLRADGADFIVDDSISQNSGQKAAGILSPKLTMVLGPWAKTEFYLDAGDGFHSNDARGTVEHLDPADGSATSPVTPLVRAEGAEMGVRTSYLPGLVSTVSIWGLDLGSELTFDGDTGETDPSGATRRYGVEFANFYHLSKAVALDGDIAFTHARYLQDTNGGSYIANSIGTVVSGGATVNFGRGWFGSLRARYFGPQPIVETGAVNEPSSLTFNGRLGWRGRDWEVSVDVLNLLNRENDDIAYDYVSRLPGEPAAGVNDVHLHPAEPRTARLSILRRF